VISILLIVGVFCGYGVAADANGPDDVNGPTVVLFSEGGEYPENTLADFMYFVPLISPVPVSEIISADNGQKGHLISYGFSKTKSKFHVSCEFRMKGSGFFMNQFDHDAMIEWNTQPGEKKTVLKNVLDYIKFEGEGYGRIEVRGKIRGSVMTAEKVEVHFDARGAESPVIIGLYNADLASKHDGHCRRFDYKVARIKTLLFNKSESAPKLGIKISAVGESEEGLGVWESIKGFFGNFFIEPIEVDKLGNDTMLEFGLDLCGKKPKFTFPKAKNLIIKSSTTAD
jgi:hypothetical protein